MTFFAHAGHDHSTITATEPWWTNELAVSLLLALGLVLVIGGAHLLKASFGLKLVITMTYLLIIGIACYSIAPTASIIALSTGMFMALGSTMLQLSHKSAAKKSDDV